MKPKEAIEILEKALEATSFVPDHPLRSAQKLGIEALDFFIEFQRVTGGHQDARLPSETKD